MAASSPYFDAMFGSGFAESSGSITTDHKPEIMKAVLRYIYTGGVEEAQLPEHCVELFAVAAEYQLEALTKRCSHQIVKQLDEESVKSTLTLAQLHSNAELKQICFQFIKNNAAKTLVRPEIIGLAADDVELWGELCEVVSGTPKPAEVGDRASKRRKTQTGTTTTGTG